MPHDNDRYSVKTKIGWITITAHNHYLTHISFAKTGSLSTDDQLLLRAGKHLHDYFDGSLTSFDLPLDYRGSVFFKDVLDALRQVPYGETITYKGLAALSGHPGAWRAAGTVCKHNPLPIVIPCHRVIRSDGDIGEFGGDKEVKRRLIDSEQRKSVPR